MRYNGLMRHTTGLFPQPALCCMACLPRVCSELLQQAIGVGDLHALAALSQLTTLCFHRLRWAEDVYAEEIGLGWLAARLPGLRVLYAPEEMLVRPWGITAH